MRIKKKEIFGCLLILTVALYAYSCSNSSLDNSLKADFKNPPNKYRPMPFWHINGNLTTEGIDKRITEARTLSGFGGVTVLPVNPNTQWQTGYPCPGTEPAYLSEEYFNRYADILSISEKQDMEVILYDDIDFPSGSAGGRLQKEYPQYTRKELNKDEFLIQGKQLFKKQAPDTTSLLLAVSAMNTKSLEVVDLKPYMKSKNLEWNVPQGEWRIMFFSCKYNTADAVDYMQPEAVSKVLEMTYDQYGKRFGKYFGNVITKTFYDDVGFVHQENVWTPAISTIFEEKYGKNPALYYPALYYDIGPETHQARVAFFDIRSELMAEGYVKSVAEWSAKNNLRSMGHPPENYSPNSVVAHGDILKYYRHTQIPLMDAIFYYGRGIHGYKQISSAADLGDKPIVGAELCGAFPADMDSLTLYRTVMDAMARGVNFAVPHGMWYTTDADKIRIPPLISHENPLLRDCLPNYSAYVGRSCMMLQGGNRVSDIALLWPITAIQGETYINRDATSGLPVANWLPEHVNHHVLSNLLTNDIRRDFTFVHPENLCNGKITSNGKELKLNNTTNIQNFKVLIMPGGDVISLSTLKSIKQYYDNGGSVIATASLPFKSAEFSADREVQRIITELFGIDPKLGIPSDIFKTNTKGGQIAFIANTTQENMETTFAKMNISADINFADIHSDKSIGYVNYIHKQKDGKDIFFFTNTTDRPLDTWVDIRGSLNLEEWNPHTGSIKEWSKTESIKDKDGNKYTRIHLVLSPVSSVFAVSI